MSGAVQSLLDLLRRGLREHGDSTVGEEWRFEACDAARLEGGGGQRVGLLVYRVELDPGARNQSAPPTRAGGPASAGVAVDLRLLLVVWAGDPLSELTVLGRCVEILDRHPVLTGDDLNPTWSWPPGAALKLSPDALGPDQLFQIWQSYQTPHRLAVPYVLRGVRLSRADELAPPVSALRVGLGTTPGEGP